MVSATTRLPENANTDQGSPVHGRAVYRRAEPPRHHPQLGRARAVAQQRRHQTAGLPSAAVVRSSPTTPARRTKQPRVAAIHTDRVKTSGATFPLLRQLAHDASDSSATDQCAPLSPALIQSPLALFQDNGDVAIRSESIVVIG